MPFQVLAITIARARARARACRVECLYTFAHRWLLLSLIYNLQPGLRSLLAPTAGRLECHRRIHIGTCSGLCHLPVHQKAASNCGGHGPPEIGRCIWMDPLSWSMYSHINEIVLPHHPKWTGSWLGQLSQLFPESFVWDLNENQWRSRGYGVRAPLQKKLMLKTPSA